MPAESQPTVSRGLIAELLSLLGSGMRYIHAVSALAAAEGREAGENYLKMAVLLLASLLFAIFGYLLALLFLAFLLASLLGISWAWICGGFAGLHLLLAVAAATAAKRRFHQPVFQTTAAELKRDFEALSKKNSAS